MNSLSKHFLVELKNGLWFFLQNRSLFSRSFLVRISSSWQQCIVRSKISTLRVTQSTSQISFRYQYHNKLRLFIIGYIFVINECDTKCVEFDIFYLRYFKHGNKGTFGDQEILIGDNIFSTHRMKFHLFLKTSYMPLISKMTIKRKA